MLHWALWSIYTLQASGENRVVKTEIEIRHLPVNVRNSIFSSDFRENNTNGFDVVSFTKIVSNVMQSEHNV